MRRSASLRGGQTNNRRHGIVQRPPLVHTLRDSLGPSPSRHTPDPTCARLLRVDLRHDRLSHRAGRAVSLQHLQADGDETLQEYDNEGEGTAGVDEFIRWATGRKNQRIRKIAGVVAPPGAAIAGAEGEDGAVEERPTDYLDGELLRRR